MNSITSEQDVPTSSFSQAIDDNFFKDLNNLQTITIDGTTTISSKSFKNYVQFF